MDVNITTMLITRTSWNSRSCCICPLHELPIKSAVHNDPLWFRRSAREKQREERGLDADFRHSNLRLNHPRASIERVSLTHVPPLTSTGTMAIIVLCIRIYGHTWKFLANSTYGLSPKYTLSCLTQFGNLTYGFRDTMSSRTESRSHRLSCCFISTTRRVVVVVVVAPRLHHLK